MKTTKKPSRLTAALLQTADDMRRAGVMDSATHEKITLRHLGDKAEAEPAPIAPEEIRALRERAHLSQAVFARYCEAQKRIVAGEGPAAIARTYGVHRSTIDWLNASEVTGSKFT